MNEQDNVALVQKLYAAFGRGDIQTILDHVAADVEWTMQGPPSLPTAGTRRGPAEVAEFFGHFAAFDNPKVTADEYLAQGDVVVTLGRFSCVVKATGKKFDSMVAHVFTIRDGRVRRFLDFLDTAQLQDAYTSASAAAS